MMILHRKKYMYDTDDRDCSAKHQWVLLGLSVIVSLLMTSLLLHEYHPPSHRTVIVKLPHHYQERSLPKYATPPNGHPWHKWPSDGIDAKPLIEELRIIDTMMSLNNDPKLKRNDLNTTFNPPYYKSLVPFVVREGRPFYPTRKVATLNSNRWKVLQEVLVDALHLAKQLQHVDPRIQAVANGTFPFILHHSDQSECNDYRGKLIPIFSWYAFFGCNYSWPVPYAQFISTKKNNQAEWNAKFQEWEKDYPWESKQRKAVWRGSLTGQNIPNWRNLPRAQLALKSREDGNRTMDAAFVEHNWRTRSQREQEAYEASLEVPRMEFQDFMKYRAILDADGNAWSGRFGLLMCFNSVVIKVESQKGYKSYFEQEELKPWKHYIPVNSDMSDLDEAVSFAISDENQAKVQGMVKNAQNWCRSKLVRDQLAADFMWILVSYVELLNKKGTGWVDEWKASRQAFEMPGMEFTEVLCLS